MTDTELAQQIQFTVDQDGQVTAVVIPPMLWQHIIEVLEDAEDRVLVRALRDRLQVGPHASGVLLWKDVADAWE